MVGLASKTLANGYLSQDAFDRGIACLRKFRRICDEHNVDTITTVATSAVREANNAQDFADAVRDQCNIDVNIISGNREAELIYLGARDHIDWGNRQGLLVDIGGGSVEFIVGNAHKASAFLSLKLGVRRLSEQFLHSDPPRRAELKQLKQHILESLEPVRALQEKHEIDFVIGSSGTLNNLAKMSARRNRETSRKQSHGLWTRLSDLKEMGRALSGLRAGERAGYHGVDTKRLDTIVAGAQLIKYILRAVDKDCYVACDYALRDGLIVDLLERQNPSTLAEDLEPRQRRRAARRLFQRFNSSGSHPESVLQHALTLFDKLEDLHHLTPHYREILEHSALLHDIGRVVHHEGHHLHSAYLIENSKLHGFDAAMLRSIALVTRLHGDSLDALQSPEFLALPAKEQQSLQALGAILRVADALDRSYVGNVLRLRCRISPEAVALRLTVKANTGLEQWALEKKSDLFTQTFGRALTASIRIDV